MLLVRIRMQCQGGFEDSLREDARRVMIASICQSVRAIAYVPLRPMHVYQMIGQHDNQLTRWISLEEDGATNDSSGMNGLELGDNGRRLDARAWRLRAWWWLRPRLWPSPGRPTTIHPLLLLGVMGALGEDITHRVKRARAIAHLRLVAFLASSPSELA